MTALGAPPDSSPHSRQAISAFVTEAVVPNADAWDRAERLPAEVVAEVGARGYLGALVPTSYGGSGLDAAGFGVLNEELGYGCSSLRSVLTVHSMVVHALARWGGAPLRERWLPKLATGECVGAFALTEPDAGSDAGGLRSTATRDGDGYRLDGVKRWITYGQAAGVFLVFARCDGQISAFLVERDTPGLTIEPMTGLLGTRASLLAELRFEGCRIAADAVVGRIGFGLTAIAGSALDVGRYSVAWGCAGLARAALDASVRYARERETFGSRIGEHQLVQRLITDMVVGVRAARLLCERAGALRDSGDPDSITAIWEAKYFASTLAFRAARDAVQIHGANGCADGYPVARLLRDAKIMELIEGTSELQQTVIAESVLRRGNR